METDLADIGIARLVDDHVVGMHPVHARQVGMAVKRAGGIATIDAQLADRDDQHVTIGQEADPRRLAGEFEAFEHLA